MRQGRLLGRPLYECLCSARVVVVVDAAHLPTRMVRLSPSLSRPTGYGPLTRSAYEHVYGIRANGAVRT